MVDNKIVHPGIYILDFLQKNNMTQKELAIRTGVTEKHINTLINGHKNITSTFAQKLGYIFEDTKFWIEKQQAYDNAILVQKQEAAITPEEETIIAELDEIIRYWDTKKIEPYESNIAQRIIKARSKLQVSNLSYIAQIGYSGNYRVQISSNAQVNPYVLYAWQRTCELLSARSNVQQIYDREKLIKNLKNIKEFMFKEISKGVTGLQNIFAECGIIFNVVKNVKGAPVQGFIKANDNEQLILCLTIRRQRADTFWFTLFHELGHIYFEDYKQKLVDFELNDSNVEKRADDFARRQLIDESDYKNFVQRTDVFSKSSIERFANEQNVKPFIVVGRLQKDQIIDYSEHNDLIPKYSWT